MRVLIAILLVTGTAHAESQLDLEMVMMRWSQTSRGGMTYYEHADGSAYAEGPGPNIGGRITITHRIPKRWSAGIAATGIWGYLAHDDRYDDHVQAYTSQLGGVVRWTFAEGVQKSMAISGSLRGELGVAQIRARADGMQVDSTSRNYGALAVEVRYGGESVAFIGSLGTTQPLGKTERVVGDEIVPEIPLGGFEMILGVSLRM